MGLQQRVITPTHESGSTLDVIITRQFGDLVRETPVSDYHISDRWSVICRLNLDKPRVTKKTVTFRRNKGVNLDVLSDEISLKIYGIGILKDGCYSMMIKLNF